VLVARAACSALAAVVWLAAAAVADAGPLVRARGVPVLAGDRVLVADDFARRDGRAVLRSVRISGGPVTRIAAVDRFVADPRSYMVWGGIDASASVVAAPVFLDSDDEGATSPTEVLAGSPAGPLRRLAGGSDTPSQAWVEGERIVYAAPSGRAHRLAVYEGGATTSFEVPAPSRSLDVAGDLVGFDSPDGRTVTVRNWRTGVDLWSVRFPQEVRTFRLRPDGAAAVVRGLTGKGGVVAVGPHGAVSAPLLRAPSGGYLFELALDGDTVVVRREHGRGLAELVATPIAGGAVRRLTRVSARLGSFDVEDGRLAWQAHDCVLAEDLATARPAAIPAGPCPRSEAVALSWRVRRDGRVAVRVRCLTAPDGCRGRVGLLGNSGRVGTAPFRIPRGPSRTVLVPLRGRNRKFAITCAVVTMVDAAGPTTCAPRGSFRFPHLAPDRTRQPPSRL
jgi:hypothetical protein